MSSPLLGSVIVETLAAVGVRHMVVCPGSRSAPIALAAAASTMTVHTRTDERSGGFLGLGLARAAGIAAIVVTSGTAVANLHPAVLEAAHSGIPLVVLSADRPLPLIGTGANQTTDQTGIFGNCLVDAALLSSTDATPAAWSQAIARVVHSALGTLTRDPGPVQINAMFGLPLVGTAHHRAVAPRIVPGPPAPPTMLESVDETVVLVGDASATAGAAAGQLAKRARLPLLAEPSSNARVGDNAIGTYRELLDTDLGHAIRRVLVYGHPTLSRPVNRMLCRDDVEIIAVTDRARWVDPGHRVSLVTHAVQIPEGDAAWLTAWQEADRRTEQELATRTGVAERLRNLMSAVVAAEPAHLVWGASNTIRHADLARIPVQSTTRCWANRGLAGIDGTIATAMGIALATGRPVTAVMGDLTFLHDIGSLHIPSGQPLPPVRLIVIDDDGGAIFSDLEVAETDSFETMFAMPHRRDLGAIAESFEWPVTRLGLDEAAGAVAAGRLPERGVVVVDATGR